MTLQGVKIGTLSKSAQSLDSWTEGRDTNRKAKSSEMFVDQSRCNNRRNRINVRPRSKRHRFIYDYSQEFTPDIDLS